MSTTTQNVFQTTENFSVGRSSFSWTQSDVGGSPTGDTWTIYGSQQNTYAVTLSNRNQNPGNQDETLELKATTSFSSLGLSLTIGDFTTVDGGVVDASKQRVSITGGTFRSNTSGFGPNFSSFTVGGGESYHYFSGLYYNYSPPTTNRTIIRSNLSYTYNPSIGTDTLASGFDFRVRAKSQEDSSNNQFQITYFVTPEFTGTATSYYETNLFIIDGVNGDSLPTLQQNTTVTVDADLFKASPVSASSQTATSQTGANTVGFPNPQYIADTYVDDTYVGITFDAQMEQVFSSRDTLSALGGRAQYASASVTSDHQTSLSGGRIQPATTSFNSDAQVLTSAGRIRSTTYTFDSINQFSSLGGNAIEGVLSMLSDSQATGTATVEIIPDANIFADSQINTVAGYLQPSGSLILGTDAQYTIDQTLGTTAGIIFSGASSIASDHATSLLGGLNLQVTTNLSTENAIQIIGGYLKQLSATFDVDHDWYAQPTLYESTAQAVLNSETQTSLLINVTFTARDTTLNTDHQFTSIGKILQAVDPYRAIDIASELRKIIIQAEIRTEATDNESRINKINQETRLDTIDSETRKVYVYDDKTIIRRTNRRVGDRI